MVGQDNVIKTDPTQIIVACIIGFTTDVDHLTFLLPSSEKVPVCTNPPSDFVLQQLRPHKNAQSPWSAPLGSRPQRCVSCSAFAQSQDDSVCPAASAFSEEIFGRKKAGI